MTQPLPPRRLLGALLLAGVTLLAAPPAQDPALAETYYEHLLVEDAKRTAIQTLFATEDPAVRLRSRILLARIAADEGRMHVAMKLWQDIAREHEDTEEARAAAVILQQAATFGDCESEHLPADPRAAVWFTAAAFWTGRPEPLPALAAWRFDAAVAAEHWLRRIVDELPSNALKRRALVRSVQAHLGRLGSDEVAGHGALGCVDGGQVGEAGFAFHMARAEQVLGELQRRAPGAVEIPFLQFSIAHVYQLAGKDELSRIWLLKVADEAKDETLWSHLARLLIKNEQR